MFNRLILSLIILFALGGCTPAVQEDQIKSDLTADVNDVFGEDVFTITELHRMGSAKDNQSEENKEGRVVYFRAKVKFNHDLTLGAWDKPSTASFVSIFGAGPKGINGIRSAGNFSGDELNVRGMAHYSFDGSRWQKEQRSQLIQSPKIDQEVELTVTEKLLNSLSEIIRSSPYTTSGVAQKVVTQELERSLSVINGRLARLQHGYALAAGGDKGEYLSFSQALSNRLEGDSFKIVPLITRGSIDNIRLLQQGDSVLAIAQADLAKEAYEGRGPFQHTGQFSKLRAIASLFPEMIHILVNQNSDITSISDLKGRTIAANMNAGSTLQAILAMYGINPSDYQLVESTLPNGLKLLQLENVDATVSISALPSKTIASAMAEANLRLVPLEYNKAAEKISAQPFTIVANTYPNQEYDISTVGMSALLLSSTELARDDVASLFESIFKDHDLISEGEPNNIMLNIDNSRRGISIPLHRGVLDKLEHRP
ncbi:TAXI family TRAP transporter solute-binding subunit [Aeromonas veronii]|uniref:TAXI family TRAP transporter solute-binding subunit n=1 Tax=Aeromonas veronii TaxID=654 RepID=UPI0009B878B6|nr:TAXI family TRAP transporter solute-binding subunit [Aeromonas veronii]